MMIAAKVALIALGVLTVVIVGAISYLWCLLWYGFAVVTRSRRRFPKSTPYLKSSSILNWTGIIRSGIGSWLKQSDIVHANAVVWFGYAVDRATANAPPANLQSTIEIAESAYRTWRKTENELREAALDCLSRGVVSEAFLDELDARRYRLEESLRICAQESYKKIENLVGSVLTN